MRGAAFAAAIAWQIVGAWHSAPVASAQTLDLLLSPLEYRILRIAPAATTFETLIGVTTAIGQETVVEIVSSSPGLRVSIAPPAGAPLDDVSFQSIGQAARYDVPAGGAGLLDQSGHHITFRWIAAVSGTWTFSVARAAGTTDEIAVTGQVLSEAAARVGLLVAPPDVQVGQPVTIVAAVFEQTVAVIGATASAEIFDPNGGRAVVTLLDDGQLADDRSGDGLYSAWFEPAVPGSHGVRVTTTGPGAAWTRVSTASFESTVRPATISGAVTASAPDRHGDGRYDSIDVDVPLQVAQGGFFELRAVLRGSGAATLPITERTPLGAGAHVVRLSAPASRVVSELTTDGPYEVRDLELVWLGVMSEVPSDSRSIAVSTPAWARADFGPPPLRFVSLLEDPADTNQDGVIDSVLVHVAIDADVVGEATGGILLQDRFGTNLAARPLSSAVTEIGTRTLTATFPVSAFDCSRKPLRFTSLFVTAGGAGLNVAEAGFSTWSCGSPPACSNLVDDDSDGLTDYPADPVCFSAEVDREDAACSDGIDNDGDGKIDFDGAASRNRGLAIFDPDPQCAHAYGNTEASQSCGLGYEVGAVLTAVAALRRRVRSNQSHRGDR